MYIGKEGDPKHAWIRRLVRDVVRAAGLTAGQ